MQEPRASDLLCHPKVAFAHRELSIQGSVLKGSNLSVSRTIVSLVNKKRIKFYSTL